MERFRCVIISLMMLLAVASAQGQQNELRESEEYRTLSDKMMEIALDESYLDAQYKINVELYKRGGDSASYYRKRVLETEQSIFDLRAEKNALQAQVRALEQRWALDNVEAAPSRPAHEIESEETDGARSISQSAIIKTTLPLSAQHSLHDAESSERMLDLKVRGYISNYRELSRLSEEYAQTSSPRTAAKILQRHTHLDSLNRRIGGEVLSRWQHISDNKSFAYSLLVETHEEMDLFEREERLKVRSQKIVDSLKGRVQSEDVLSYYASRVAMVEYERLLAERFNLTKARDSLKYIGDSLRMAGFNMPRVVIEERLFINYEAVKFSTKPVYTGANPIPNGVVYEKGTMYRLLVGSFKSRQAASMFRGAYPISIIKSKDGLLSYYLGGYETLSEAQAAREMLLKRGFRRPEIVEWVDGKSWNITRSPRPVVARYRVEIVSSAELSADVKSVIATQGAGRELTKVDSRNYVVGIFDNLQSAEHLKESVSLMDSSVKISIVEVR